MCLPNYNFCYCHLTHQLTLAVTLRQTLQKKIYCVAFLLHSHRFFCSDTLLLCWELSAVKRQVFVAVDRADSERSSAGASGCVQHSSARTRQDQTTNAACNAAVQHSIRYVSSQFLSYVGYDDNIKNF